MADRSLADYVAVEELDTDLYRGAASPEVQGRVFGGPVIAQALAAATASLDADKVAHSLHAYFLRAGDNARPIIYRVLRDFDGGSFANRRVVALQGGQPILNLAASFQRKEDGFAYAEPMPQVPGPEKAFPLGDLVVRQGGAIPPPIASQIKALDIRGVPPGAATEGATPSQHAWLRLDGGLGESLARVALAYASDFGLVSTAILPHKINWFSPGIQGASLDHAVWFHADPPLGEWLLYAMDTPWSGNARGFARGSVYDQSGRLIASMAQEGLMRFRPRQE